MMGIRILTVRRRHIRTTTVRSRRCHRSADQPTLGCHLTTSPITTTPCKHNTIQRTWPDTREWAIRSSSSGVNRRWAGTFFRTATARLWDRRNRNQWYKRQCWRTKAVHQDRVLVSPAQDPSSCGSSCSSCWQTNRARTSYRGRGMVGSLNWAIRMRWPVAGASARTNPKWTMKSCRAGCATTTTKTSSTKPPANDTSTVSFAISKICWGKIFNQL